MPIVIVLILMRMIDLLIMSTLMKDKFQHYIHSLHIFEQRKNKQRVQADEGQFKRARGEFKINLQNRKRGRK